MELSVRTRIKGIGAKLLQVIRANALTISSEEAPVVQAGLSRTQRAARQEATVSGH